MRTQMRVKITRKAIIASEIEKEKTIKWIIMMVIAEITCRLNTKLKKSIKVKKLSIQKSLKRTLINMRIVNLPKK